MKIGVMFGSPETHHRRQRAQFYASVRLDIRRIGAVKERDEVIGNETRVKVVKNKVAPPFRQTEFQILYGKGIYRNAEIIDLGVQQGVVEKSGAWYSHGTERIGQGKKNAAEWLDGNPTVRDGHREPYSRSDCCLRRPVPTLVRRRPPPNVTSFRPAG